MNTIISATGHLTIAGFLFTCAGTYNGTGNRWLINASWQAGTGQSISIQSIISQIVPSFNFDPGHLLPDVSFTAINGQFDPEVSSSFACTANIAWSEPFGIPLGLDIDGLNFSLAKQTGASLQIQADGNVDIEGSNIHTAVYFTDGKPTFILVNAIPTFSLSGLVHHFFGSSVSIPGNFIDLTCANSQVYYLPQGGSVPTGIPLPTPQKGLNVAAQVTLVLAGYTFPTIDVNVNVASGNGVLINGSFQNSIGIAGFLTLTGANAGYTNGPSLNISSQNGNKTFGLDCGLQFLGENFGLAGITIVNKNGKNTFTTTLTYPGTLGPFTNPSLSLVYDGSNFYVSNWPGVSAENLAIDFAQALKNINSAQGCGKVLELVLNQTVQTHFTISPNFTTKKPDIPGVADGQFYLVLTGFYTISAAGTVVCSLDMPELALSFSAPSAFSFDNIMATIGQIIEDNAEAVVQQLVNNPQALAQFILVFAGKQAAKKMVSQICNKALSASLETFLGSISSVGSGVLSALGAAAGALASMGCGSNKGGSSSGGGGNSPNIKPLATPQITSSALEGTSWTVTWNSVSGTNYYQVIVSYNNTKTVIDVQYVMDTAATITLPDAYPNAPYTCQVVAWANPGMNYNSEPVSIMLNRLGQPITASMSIDYSTGVLTCTFSPVSNATGYTTTVYENGGTQTAQTSAFTVEADGKINVNFKIMNFIPMPQQYTIGIISTGGSQYIPGVQWVTPVQALNWGVGYCEVGQTFNIS